MKHNLQKSCSPLNSMSNNRFILIQQHLGNQQPPLLIEQKCIKRVTNVHDNHLKDGLIQKCKYTLQVL